MKYVLAALIILGGLAVLIGICYLIAITVIKVQETHYLMERKYQKYRKFCEVMSDKIGPAIFLVFIAANFCALIVISYFIILNLL